MKSIKSRIYLKAIGVQILLIIAMKYLIPLLANYPIYSEEPEFQRQIETLTHNEQYLVLGSIFIIAQIIFIHFIFRKIFKYLSKDKSQVTVKEVEEVRNSVFSVPKKLLISQTIILIVMIITFSSIVEISLFLCIKFVVIYFSFFTAGWVIITTLLQNELDKIIESTYKINKRATLPKKQSKFYVNLMKSLVPFFLVIMIVITLLSYSRIINLNGESRYYYYKQNISSINLNGQSIEKVRNSLSQIPLFEESNYYFIITEEEQYFSDPQGKVTPFFIEYAREFIRKTGGRVYEYYGLEEEAIAKYIKLNNGELALIGIKYSTSNKSVLYYLAFTVIICIAIYIILLLVWTRNTSKNITRVSQKLSRIAKKYDVNADVSIMPALSNDEIGQLVIAFNAIRHRNKENIKKIKNGQDMLMERERLATLGQMVGGIAHNLKTPIMSIAGAMKGLEDLVNEYEKSITDPEVTIDDHREIAKDMKIWIEKVNSYDAYMSDVITTVKGQAVNFNDESSETFTIEDLIKRVDILMKQELKNSLVKLNIECTMPKDVIIRGNVNSLVQVVNNLISNAIQSYETNNKSLERNNVIKKEPIINLKISDTKEKLIIIVEDFGSGIPKEVQDKLFKSMVTTKGRNGTGLGLFMSYSTIKGHFNGELTFKTKAGKGTTFRIIIPK